MHESAQEWAAAEKMKVVVEDERVWEVVEGKESGRASEGSGGLVMMFWRQVVGKEVANASPAACMTWPRAQQTLQLRTRMTNGHVKVNGW